MCLQKEIKLLKEEIWRLWEFNEAQRWWYDRMVLPANGRGSVEALTFQVHIGDNDERLRELHRQLISMQEQERLAKVCRMQELRDELYKFVESVKCTAQLKEGERVEQLKELDGFRASEKSMCA